MKPRKRSSAAAEKPSTEQPAGSRTPTYTADTQPTAYRTPTYEQISSRARELWEDANRPEGRDVEFWLAAERSLIFPASIEEEVKPAVPPPEPDSPSPGPKPM